MKDRTVTLWHALVGGMAGALLLAIAATVAPATAHAAAGEPADSQAPVTQLSAPPTVLDGVFTATQADRGDAVYNEKCATCHDGADVDGPPLTGAPFVDRWREDTLDGLFEFIKTRMPQTAPGSLPESAYLDIVAHLLHENDYPPGQHELTTDLVRSTLVVGPNGPQPLPSGALVRVVGCLTRNAAREWVIARAAEAARTRTGNEITPADITAAGSLAPGTETFALQNVGDDGIALPAEGHTVLVKGALTQRAGTGRIHVTAASSVAGTCG
jgi:S-disulfanyl-L-cysteine oxidoreductase SoxD